MIGAYYETEEVTFVGKLTGLVGVSQEFLVWYRILWSTHSPSFRTHSMKMICKNQRPRPIAGKVIGGISFEVVAATPKAMGLSLLKMVIAEMDFGPNSL